MWLWVQTQSSSDFRTNFAFKIQISVDEMIIHNFPEKSGLDNC